MQNTNNDTITITDDSILIRASEFIKHDGYTHHISVLIRALNELLSRIGSKKIIFRFDDGEPIKIVAFDQIVHDIADMLGLDKKNILFECVDHTPRTELDFPMILYHSGFFSLAKDLVRTESCELDQQYFLFGAFFGRFTLHRMLMAYFLESRLPETSIVGFQPDYKWAEFEIGTLRSYFSDQMAWMQSRREKNVNLESVFNGCVSANDCLPVYHEIFGKYAIEIIIETNVHDIGWFTEKTTKCLASGKPFLLLGTSGQLQSLRDMGFRTFSNVIDESYDLEHNLEKRFDMICAEINRLAGLDTHDRSSVVNKLYEIAEYNKINYEKIIDNYYQMELI